MPGMANPVDMQALVTARELRTAFVETYNGSAAKLSPNVQRIMAMASPSDKISELYGYRETRPYPSLWRRGEEISRSTFRGVTYTIVNYRWGHAIDWDEDDEDDDQLGGHFDDVRDLGRNFAVHPERVLFQLLLAATDRELLPAVPNAPDGAALFAATAGGSDRFGISGGNTISGTGVATQEAILADYYSALVRALTFQDTKGQPLFDRDAMVGAGIIVIYAMTNERRFAEAFVQRVNLAIVATGSSAGTNVGGAGLTNLTLDHGTTPILWSTPRITNNTWYVGLLGTPVPPFLEQLRRAVTDNLATFENSDRTRATNIRSYQVKARLGYGINLPYGLIEVDNS